MANNNAFTLSGANPLPGIVPNGTLGKTTPLSNNTSTPNGTSTAPITPSTGTSTGFINSAVNSGALKPVGTNPGLLQPTTAVKSIASPDGTTTTFHAPGTDANGNNLSTTGGATGAGMQPATPTSVTPGGYNPDGTPISHPIDYSGTNQGNPNGQPGAQPQIPSPYTANPNLQGQLITGLANSSQQPSDAYKAAQANADAINQQIERAKAQMAQQTKDINTSGTWTSRALGEQGQANIANTSTLAALGSQYQGAQNQVGQAIAQGGQQQAALTGAISANAPQFPGYQTPVYNPATGTFTNNSGGAFYGGQVAGEQALGQQYAQNVSANNQAVGIKNQIVSFLNNTPINPSQFTDLNSIIGLLSGKVSDPKYTQLSAQLTEYLNTLAPILGVGGDTTNLKTQIAQSMLDGRMQPAAIAQVLNTIEQTAQTKLQQQQFGGQTNGQTNTSNASAPNPWH